MIDLLFGILAWSAIVFFVSTMLAIAFGKWLQIVSEEDLEREWQDHSV